jgi:hypothetical protein
MDASTQAWLDQADANLATIIRRHGWAIQYVGGALCSGPRCDCVEEEGPPFAYTIGLFGLGHPELLIFGVDTGTAFGVLDDLGERVRAGEALLPGIMIEFEDWPHRVIPEFVPNPGEIVFIANAFYQRPAEASVPVLQMSYDDVEGRFPWEEGYTAPRCNPARGRSWLRGYSVRAAKREADSITTWAMDSALPLEGYR